MNSIKRTEINEIHNIQSVSKTSNIELTNTDGYYTERYYFTDIYEDKKLNAMIKCCEREIRRSDQYRSYIGFLKNDIGLTKCAILGNVRESEKVTIEQHHYPFTLYDIVYLNIMKRIMNKEKINSFLVSQEVLNDHFDNIIGVVPLCKTVHKLVHSGNIFINLKSVFGDIQGFICKYGDYMNDDMIEKYNQIAQMSKNNIAYSENNILEEIKNVNNNPEDLN